MLRIKLNLYFFSLEFVLRRKNAAEKSNGEKPRVELSTEPNPGHWIREYVEFL